MENKMIKITADSTCDLSPELVEKYNFALFPLIVNLGAESEFDGPDLPEKIYEFGNRTKSTPKTAARSTAEYQEFFEKNKPANGYLIHFNISKEISASHQNATAAAKAVPGVYVIDSRSLSTGTAISMLRAAKLVEQGVPAEKIVDRITANIDQVQASFIVKDLTYLHRGGRCSGTAKLFATALGIKPQIYLKDGKMISGKKFMGNFESCVKKYVAETLKTYNHPDLSVCFITHTKMDNPKIVDQIKEQIQAQYQFAEICETIAGGTVTSHCGPNTIGILYGLA